MCLALSKHFSGHNIPSLLHMHFPAAWLSTLLFLSVSFLIQCIDLGCPNTPAPVPWHSPTPDWKPIQVSSGWKYHNNLYVLSWYLLFSVLLLLSLTCIDRLTGAFIWDRIPCKVSVIFCLVWIGAQEGSSGEIYDKSWRKWDWEISFLILSLSAGLILNIGRRRVEKSFSLPLNLLLLFSTPS